MSDVTVDATLSIKDGLITRPMTPADLKGDPAAGPGALDASVQQVRAAVAAVQGAIEARPAVDVSPVTAAVNSVKAAVDAEAAAGHADLDAIRALLAAALTVHVDNPTDVSALAKDATLLAALNGVAKDASLAGLATDATLGALSAKLGVPASDDVLALLRTIVTNTGTEVTRTETLELTAEQVRLNTQGVEDRLDTVNTRLGNAATAGSVAQLVDAVRQLLAGTLTAHVDNQPATDGVTGAALPARRLLIAGSDGNVVREINVDAGGGLRLQSSGTPGVAAPGRSVGVAGVDVDGLLRALLVRASGAQVVDSDTLGKETTQLAIRDRLPAALDASGAMKVASSASADQVVSKNLVGTSQGGTSPGDGTGTAELMALVRPGDTQAVFRTGAVGVSGLNAYARNAVDGAWSALNMTSMLGGGIFQQNELLGAISVAAIPRGTDAIRLVLTSSGAPAPVMIATGPGDAPIVLNQLTLAGTVGSTTSDGASQFKSEAPMFGYSGGWDRWRSHSQQGLAGTAARTATLTNPDVRTYNVRGCVVTLNVTAVSGTGGLTVRVDGKDAQGIYHTVLIDSAPVTAIGNYAYEIAPGAGAAAGAFRAAVSRLLPHTMRVVVVHGDATSYTYNVALDLLA